MRGRECCCWTRLYVEPGRDAAPKHRTVANLGCETPLTSEIFSTLPTQVAPETLLSPPLLLSFSGFPRKLPSSLAASPPHRLGQWIGSRARCRRPRGQLAAGDRKRLQLKPSEQHNHTKWGHSAARLLTSGAGEVNVCSPRASTSPSPQQEEFPKSMQVTMEQRLAPPPSDRGELQPVTGVSTANGRTDVALIPRHTPLEC